RVFGAGLQTVSRPPRSAQPQVTRRGPGWRPVLRSARWQGRETLPQLGPCLRKLWEIIPGLFLRTRFIGAGAFFCARWGARGAECLPRDVRRRSSQATSRFDGSTVHRCLCVRTGSGIMEARPHPEGCPRQEPLGRNRPAAFTLCYKVSGPSALPRALSQWTRGKEMEMIENCQNRAGFSGVCHCQTTTYDKKIGSPTGALSAAETSETSTNLNRTPVQYR